MFIFGKVFLIVLRGGVDHSFPLRIRGIRQRARVLGATVLLPGPVANDVSYMFATPNVQIRR